MPPLASHPIDLLTALRLAESVNPVIGAARARIGEALGRQLRAQVILVPTLNVGMNYYGHTGTLQRSTGQIIRVSNQSLYFGGGTLTDVQNTVQIPAVNIAAHLTDAWFEPLAALQVVNAARYDASATAHTVLLGVADDFLTLQGAVARLHARRRTESEAGELARITAAFARTGEGRQADADRAATHWKMQRALVRRAEEDQAVASAKLVRRLHIQEAARIAPEGDALDLYHLVSLEAPLEGLLETAVRQRPELQARGADVAAAEYRVQQARYRPFLPMVWLGFSGGAFGGGSNLVPPTMGNFGGRTDFDVVAFWTLQNLGFGNLALVKQRRAEADAAARTRSRVLNQVRDDVATARADALENRARIRVAVEELATAQDGFEKDLQRIQGAAGPPLEVLDNLRLLGAAREALIDAVVGYNRAQFRLFVSLGSPPPLQRPSERPPQAASAVLAEGEPQPDGAR